MPGQRNETSLGAGGRDFRPTAWTEVLAARDADTTEARLAWDQLVGVYWKPVYFGLAKMAAGAPGAAGVKPEGHATVSGQVMGTPHYMAPEQVENMARVDHRADIYSLGVVFYEMLTGELPLGRFPAPSQRVQVDVRFDEVVLKALEKEPEKRYQRASCMSQDLTRIATGAVLAGPPARASQGKVADSAGKPDPESSPAWLRVLSLVLLAIDIVGMAVLCSAIISSKNAFKQMFSDMNIGTLPALPSVLVAMPNLGYVLAFGSAALILAIKELAIRRRAVSLGLNALALVLGTGFFFVYLSALFVPMNTLMSRLSADEVERPAANQGGISWGQPANGLQAGLAVKQARLEAGRTLSDVAVHLKNAGAPDRSLRPSGLPPGKYRLTGIYCGDAARTGVWQGAVATGPVEIEIVEPARAGQPAPPRAPAK
jgi:hypothetical protein